VKIALGQINPTVGDFSGNANKIIDFSRRAREAGAGLILFPELSVCGYPPRDLVERPTFVAKNRESVERISRLGQRFASARDRKLAQWAEGILQEREKEVAGLAEGVDGEMTLRIDAEVPRAPARNVVQLQRPLDGPVGIRH